MKRHWAFVGLLSTAVVSAQAPEPAQPLICVFPPTPVGTTVQVAAPPAPLPLDAELNALQTANARLKAEREALTQDKERVEKTMTDTANEDAAELTRLRTQLTGLLLQLDKQKKTPTRRVEEAPSPAPPTTTVGRQPALTLDPPTLTPRLTEPLQLAQAQFRAREYETALMSLRRFSPESLSKEDQVLAQYLTACCLRNLGKLEEAAAIYREIVNSRTDDEVLLDCAKWQLNAINSRRETERQLAEIRARREGK